MEILLSRFIIETNKPFFKKREIFKKKKQECGNKDYRKFIVERQSLSVNGTTTRVVRLAHTHAKQGISKRISLSSRAG